MTSAYEYMCITVYMLCAHLFSMYIVYVQCTVAYIYNVYRHLCMLYVCSCVVLLVAVRSAEVGKKLSTTLWMSWEMTSWKTSKFTSDTTGKTLQLKSSTNQIQWVNVTMSCMLKYMYLQITGCTLMSCIPPSCIYIYHLA